MRRTAVWTKCDAANTPRPPANAPKKSPPRAQHPRPSLAKSGRASTWHNCGDAFEAGATRAPCVPAGALGSRCAPRRPTRATERRRRADPGSLQAPSSALACYRYQVPTRPTRRENGSHKFCAQNRSPQCPGLSSQLLLSHWDLPVTTHSPHSPPSPLGPADRRLPSRPALCSLSPSPTGRSPRSRPQWPRSLSPHRSRHWDHGSPHAAQPPSLSSRLHSLILAMLAEAAVLGACECL